MSVKRNRADNKYPIRSDGAKQVPAACVLAWIVPGMGHFYLRKWSHGLLFFLAINTLFFLGCYLGGDLEIFWGNSTDRGPFCGVGKNLD